MSVQWSSLEGIDSRNTAWQTAAGWQSVQVQALQPSTGSGQQSAPGWPGMHAGSLQSLTDCQCHYGQQISFRVVCTSCLDSLRCRIINENRPSWLAEIESHGVKISFWQDSWQNIGERPYVHKRSSIQTRWHELFQPASMDHGCIWTWIRFYTRKGIRLYFVMSSGKMIFAILELWMSPLQWVLNW